jgi:hypothetical protein
MSEAERHFLSISSQRIKYKIGSSEKSMHAGAVGFPHDGELDTIGLMKGLRRFWKRSTTKTRGIRLVTAQHRKNLHTLLLAGRELKCSTKRDVPAALPSRAVALSLGRDSSR